MERRVGDQGNGGSRRARRPGRPGFHDPTAGIGGAAPARSALTLRLVLAAIGLTCFACGAIALAVTGGPPAFVIVFALGALVALLDLVVVARRKRSGEPG